MDIRLLRSLADSKELKINLVGIQDKINNTKDVARAQLTKLEKEEEQLMDELKAFERNMNEWNKPTRSLFPKLRKPSKPIFSENVSKEVKEFMAFVAASGGHEGWWSPPDHNLFLKTRAKFKDNPNKVAQNLHLMLPGKRKATGEICPEIFLQI